MASKLNTQDVSTILSRLPGVGNEEFTEKERDYILKLAHSKNIRPKEAHDKSTGADMLEGVDIPRFVGRYDIREYQLPQEQPKYNVDDEAIQCKLSDIYEQDRDGLLEDGHDMVIASSTDLCLDPSAELLNKPVVEGERIVLFLNGGGFIMSDTAALKWFYLRISKELGQRVFVPRYNIAPKHVFPRALHDVYTAYSHLIVQGFKPENINLMGTSSGGQLAVALMLLRYA
ncbi:alpha/beta hydrolase fold-domain-containing protein [Coemansia spiralis]|nr:alpha/beta hydrolase fold-domain-containing protein [Coemansia spiralis]